MFPKILLLLQEHFNATPKEARGYLVMILLSGLMVVLPAIFRSFVIPHVYKSEVRLVNLPESSVQPSVVAVAYEDDTIESERVALFSFNPNEVSIEDMQVLGIPSFLAKRIANYRLRGGSFKKKEDLLKIYDFPEPLYHQLEPYIELAAAVTRPTTQTHREPKAEDRKQEELFPKRADKPILFDINQADSAQLIAIRGIGPVFALRILKYRNALGGFHDLAQLQEVYKLEADVIREMKKHVHVASPVSLVPINTIEFKDLLKHPYLWGKRKEVQVLINYRKQHGLLQSAEDIYQSKSLDSVTIRRILPYLDFNQ